MLPFRFSAWEENLRGLFKFPSHVYWFSDGNIRKSSLEASADVDLLSKGIANVNLRGMMALEDLFAAHKALLMTINSHRALSARSSEFGKASGINLPSSFSLRMIDLLDFLFTILSISLTLRPQFSSKKVASSRI